MTQVIEAADLASILSVLSDSCGAVQVRSLSEPAGMRLVLGSLGPIDVNRVTFCMDLDVDVGPLDELVFGIVNSGAAGFRTDTAEHWHGEGDVYLAGQPCQFRTSMFRGGEHDQAVIDRALIRRVADTAPNRSAGPIQFTGYAAVSKQAAALWKSAFAYVRELAVAGPQIAEHPLVGANAALLLAAAALSAFPSNALTDPTIEDRHDAHTATLRRAVAYIDEHAHQDITPADIADAARVSIRAVQLAFRRQLDTTPMEYLRRVRLEHAHQDLVAADPAHDSVTVIAYRWGFPSLSRFAAYYRQAYGIQPSHSLRN